MLRILCLTLLLIMSTAHARQVEGRPTLPSDCTNAEVWVRDHAKITGNWTAYCRARNGVKSSSGYNFIAPKFKPGMPKNWIREREWPAEWQSKDVSDILWAIEQIPEPLWVTELQGLHRMERSKDYPNPGIYLQGAIVLYDTAFQHESYTARVLAHELAHARFKKFSTAQKLDYQKSTGWRIASRRYLKEEYRMSLDEDFASIAEFFIFEPDTLKKVSHSAYLWMEKFIGKNPKKENR